jgi:integrase
MRYQRGYLYKRSGAWRLRYSKDGKQPEQIIGRVSDLSKSEARKQADDFIRTVNEGRNQASMTVDAFVEKQYLPYCRVTHKASTIYGYERLYGRYLKEKLDKISLATFQTSDGERILGSVAQHEDLSVTTLGHVKAFLSGIFRYALRLGERSGFNPMSAVEIPRARGPQETTAYSLEEVQAMMASFPEPAATIVAVAAFTGLRKGEISALRWEDYGGQELQVQRAEWRGVVGEPKSAKSKAPVPVIPQLAERLDSLAAAKVGPMFPGVNLDTLARKYGIRWHGFRRGLATTLRSLGVPDTVTQRVLRHAAVSVTQRCYIKTADGDAQEALGKLAAKLG